MTCEFRHTDKSRRWRMNLLPKYQQLKRHSLLCHPWASKILGEATQVVKYVLPIWMWQISFYQNIEPYPGGEIPFVRNENVHFFSFLSQQDITPNCALRLPSG